MSHRNLRFACLSLVFVPLAASCDGAPASPDPLAGAVAKMGFSPTGIVDRGSYVLVEGDIVINRDALRRGRSGVSVVHSPPRFQWSTTTLMTNGPVDRPVRVYLNTSFRSYTDWTRAAREAFGHWNAVPAVNFRFVEVTSASGADVTLTTVSQPCYVLPCTLATAAWPTVDGKPGSAITVNVGFKAGLGPGGVPTYGAMVHAMAHELGHVIGLRHSNWIARGETASPPGALLVGGTDAASVMNGGTENQPWAGFSAGDRTAVRVLYTGAAPRGLTGSIEYGHPKLSWTAVGDAVEYRVYRFPVEQAPFVYAAEYQGSTSATSYVDTTRARSTAAVCGFTEYQVVAVFPEGTVTLPYGAACFY